MTVDRFDQQVEDHDSLIRRLQRDQSAVTFRSPQYFALQRRIDRAVAAKHLHESNLPTLRRTDRAVTVRLVLVLGALITLVGVLVVTGLITPWFLIAIPVLAFVMYGVLTTPR
jgi:hypothetical protein